MFTHQAFDRMLKHCGIRAKDLAALSGVSESRISQFRNGLFLAGKGSDITSKALDDLLEAAQALHSDALWIYSCYRCDRESDLVKVSVRSTRVQPVQGGRDGAECKGVLCSKGANFHSALEQTLKDFDLSPQGLAERSGVSSQLIEEFRQGQPLQTDSLEQVIHALPDEARWHFFSSLLEGSLAPEQAIRYMNSEQLSGMLLAIAEKINQPNGSEEKSRLPQTSQLRRYRKNGNLEVGVG
jgi:transcriptional regulator with XRE-family HTH domain